MGIVYKAKHLRLDRMVAIKMLLAGPFASAAELARFVREAKSIAALHHPNIVQVYDVGDVEGRPYYTMELYEGGTLAQKLAGKPLDALEAADLVFTLAQAIHVAHIAGIVHRDLKPSNILLTSDGVPKISDFGLARRSENDSLVTAFAAKLGTPSYMSPEQTRGSATALSPSRYLRLGQFFTRHLPADRHFSPIPQPKHSSRFYCRIRFLLHVSIMEWPPAIWIRFVRNAPRKEPQKRYGTAADLAADLRRFEMKEPTAARPVGTTERASAGARHPTASTMLAASVLIVATLLGSSMRLAVQQAHLRGCPLRWT